jgi:hypothetical protein
MNSKNHLLHSGVLYYVIFILLVVWFICLGIMLAWKLHFVIYSGNLQSSIISDRLISAKTIYCSTPDTLQYSKILCFAFSKDTFPKVLVTKKQWGLFDILDIQIKGKRNEIRRIYLAGINNRLYEKIALYLAEEKKYLSVSGNTQITGTCYLPQLGVRTSYVEGKGYYGAKTVYGTIKTSKEKLPEIKKERLSQINTYITDFSPLKSDSVFPFEYLRKKNSLSNSFQNATIVFHSNSLIVLSNIEISGNIILLSGKMIRIKNSCNLEGIIVVAPKIIIDDGFKGQLQAFALDSFVIGKKVSLLYPSVVSVCNNTNSNCYLSIKEKSRIEGIIYIDQEKKSAMLPLLVLEKETNVYGQVYCNGVVNIRGNVFGSLYCKRFILETKTSFYENHLLDNQINRHKLSDHYSGIIFIDDSIKPQMQIIECLN